MGQRLKEASNIILDEIYAARSCCVIDDTKWNEQSGRFTGSLLWHGIPTTTKTLRAFADFGREVARSLKSEPEIVVGVASSGICWATALSLEVDKPLVQLRINPHKYGVWNAEARRHPEARALVVDNFAGSGDTLRMARQLLDDLGISTEQMLVVEAGNPSEQISLLSALATNHKLERLLELNYFTTLETEVVEHYLRDPFEYLDDTEWVRSVKSRLKVRLP